MVKQLRGNILLLITALIWGTAFVAQSEGMNYIEPFTYNALRTLLGGLILIPVICIFRKTGVSDASKPKAPLRTTVTGGILCGIVLCVASSFQQCGITMTTAGKAGFITALYIVIVPILFFVLYHRSSPLIWIAVLIAATGFWLLCIKEGFHVGMGDLLVLCCAFFFAVHIMVIDHFNAKHVDAVLMSCIQFFTAGILMAICMFLFEKPELSSIYGARYTILYAGIMSSGVAYTLQILGQRDTNPASATLLMSLESVFAALSGWLILHEVLSAKELLGCALVFAAVILAQFQQPSEHSKKSKRMEKINEKTSE